MQLYYGMKILTKMPKVNWIPILGIGLSSSCDKRDEVECSVEKYWKDDIDANSYKVKLVPSNPEDVKIYGTKSLYSMDLSSSLKTNTSYKLIK